MDRKRNVKLIRKRRTGGHNSWENHDKYSNKSPMILAENCVEFCRETTLHGFKYIFEKNSNDGGMYLRKVRRIIAYIIWITSVICGAAFGFYLMSLVWERYRNTPTITNVETNNYPIWNIPFPAVTVCNLNSVYKPSTKELTKQLSSRGIREDKISLFFSNLGKLINFSPIDKEFVNIFDALDELNYTTERLMLELAMPCEEMFVRCFWHGQSINCKTIFRFSKSSEGFCCSFNYRLPQSDKLGEKFTNLDYYNKSEWRTAGSGQDVGLRMHLNIQEENYVAERKPYHGVNVIIHESDDYPESTLAHAVGQPGEEVGIAVIPTIVSTDESVRNVDINRRFCIFEDERRLKISGPYSFSLCLTECRAFTIIKKCNCLPFFFPDIDTSNSGVAFRQCTLRDVQCLAEHNHIFSSLEPPADLKDIFNKTNIGMECDCYPSCSETLFDVSVTNAKRFTKETSTKRGGPDNANWTIIRVYFKDLSCIKYKREIYMTWDGVLSSFGGIFGLCMGGSVISIIEFVYLVVFKYLYKSIGYKAEPVLTVVTTQKKILPRADNRRVKPVFEQNKQQVNAKPMEYQFLM